MIEQVIQREDQRDRWKPPEYSPERLRKTLLSERITERSRFLASSRLRELELLNN